MYSLGDIYLQEWWTHLWLNEGFASWIEYLCVDHCFPEYDIWTQFASTDFTRALELDALKNSHPIEVCMCSAMAHCTGGTLREQSMGAAHLTNKCTCTHRAKTCNIMTYVSFSP